MKIETTSNGVYIGGKYGGVTFQAFNPKYQFTVIDWTTDYEAGYLTTSFTLLNCQIVVEVAIDQEKIAKFEAKLKQGEKEFKEGDFYFFVHNKNPLLKDFGEFMEENEGLRFWQGLSAWTGKDITVGGEDPFYWTKKLQ